MDKIFACLRCHLPDDLTTMAAPKRFRPDHSDELSADTGDSSSSDESSTEEPADPSPCHQLSPVDVNKLAGIINTDCGVLLGWLSGEKKTEKR